MNNNKKSGGGIIFGFILFIAGVGLLWWNEGRTVKTASAIKEANDLVVDISSSEINSEFEGKVVNTNGEAIYNDVNDPDFDIELNALVLNRVVEMYQWSEDCDDDNVCTYTKKWDSNLISSASFQSGHTNPDNMPYDSKTYYAENVNLGAFIIPTDFLIKKILPPMNLAMNKCAIHFMINIDYISIRISCFFYENRNHTVKPFRHIHFSEHNP